MQDNLNSDIGGRAENLYNNSTGTGATFTTSAASYLCRTGVLVIRYYYSGVHNTLVYAADFSSSWTSVGNFIIANPGTNPLVQVLIDSISVSWDASTKKLL